MHAILINERGAEQKMVEMLERRHVVVVRLMDNQSGGRDDRQLLLLPPGSAVPAPTRRAGAPADAAERPAKVGAGPFVFPNVPYEENKYH